MARRGVNLYGIPGYPGYEWDQPPSDAAPFMELPVITGNQPYTAGTHPGPKTKAAVGQTASGLVSGPNSFLDFLTSSIAGAPEAAWRGISLPYDAMQGKVSPTSDEAISRSADAASMVTLGSGAVPGAGLGMGLRRMYHGSHDPIPFENLSTENTRNNGVHLSASPDVASSYAGMLADPENIGPAGSRIYPVNVDPGKVLDMGGGLPNWWDPEYFHDVGKWTGNDDIVRLSKIMDDSGNIGDPLQKLGYDSVLYTHENPLNYKAPEAESLLVADAQRIKPAWSSPEGIVKPDPALHPSQWEEWVKEEIKRLGGDPRAVAEIYGISLNKTGGRF
jgi:hypothetical protein